MCCCVFCFFKSKLPLEKMTAVYFTANQSHFFLNQQCQKKCLLFKTTMWLFYLNYNEAQSTHKKTRAVINLPDLKRALMSLHNSSQLIKLLWMLFFHQRVNFSFIILNVIWHKSNFRLGRLWVCVWCHWEDPGRPPHASITWAQSEFSQWRPIQWRTRLNLFFKWMQ